MSWIPERGESVDVLAVGRSGDAICGHTVAGARRVLVRGGFSFRRPVEGEVFTVEVALWSREGSFWTLEGALGAPRFDADALHLEPLALLGRRYSRGREGGDERPEFELERIVPRVPGFPLSGSAAVDELVAFHESGEHDLAELLAGELLSRDLRCLEAHALLGSFYSHGPLEHRWTERALRHFRVGATIGELSLGAAFSGRLPWRWCGNRAFLRCLAGWGRALHRVGDQGSARQLFERLLTLAPEDPMGVRDSLSSAAG
jgi:hypothetical protein